MVVGDRNGIHAGDRSAVCYYRPAGGVDGTGASLREQARREYAVFRGFDRGGGSRDGCHFYSWPGGDGWRPLVSSVRSRLEILWIKDAAGLLLLAPLCTLHSREAIIENSVGSSATANFVDTGAAESPLNLAYVISAFETSAPKVVSQIRETPVHRTG